MYEGGMTMIISYSTIVILHHFLPKKQFIKNITCILDGSCIGVRLGSFDVEENSAPYFDQLEMEYYGGPTGLLRLWCVRTGVSVPLCVCVHISISF